MENQLDRQAVSLPKNIRQIGNFGDTYKIYVEDFVYTYVHQFLHEKKRDGLFPAAVLLGEIRQDDAARYVFISGAQGCDLKVLSEDGEEQTAEDEQEFWNTLYQRIKQFFSGKEILGWYVSSEGGGLEITPQLSHFFEKTYSRGSRFLYYEDSLERLDAFFVQEQHALQRISGYAVYYEKNPQMQEFMISERERYQPEPVVSPASEAKGEDVASNYRAIMNKLNEKPKRKKVQPVLYVAGAAVLAVAAATGITQIGNYQNLRGLENTLQTLSGAVTGVQEDTAEVQDGGKNLLLDAEKEQGQASNSVKTESAANQNRQEQNTETSGSGGEAGQEQNPETSGSENAAGQGQNPETSGSENAAGQEQKTETSGNGNVVGQGSPEQKTEESGNGSKDAQSGQGQNPETSGSENAAGQGSQEQKTETSGGGSKAAQSDQEKKNDKSASGTGQAGSAQQETAPADAVQRPEYYTVKKGDSLVSISRKFYKTIKMVDKICSLNKIKDMDVIYEGQKLRLP